MNISKSIYANLDKKFWRLKRHQDYFYAFHTYDKAIYTIQGNKAELAFEYPQSKLSAFDIFEDNLLAGTRQGELVLWDIHDAKPKRILSLRQDLWISSVKFLDAEMLALGFAMGEVTLIYSLKNEKIIDTIPSGISDLRDAQHGNVLVFDNHSGLFLYDWKMAISEDYVLTDEIISPVFSPDGRFIVCQNSYDLPSSNIELLVYETEGMHLLQRIDTLSTSGGTRYLIFDEYLVATMPDLNRIGIWDILTGKNILIEDVELFQVNHLDFDPLRRELIIGTGYDIFPDNYIIEIWKIT